MKYDIRHGNYHEGKQEFMSGKALRDMAIHLIRESEVQDLMEKHTDEDVAMVRYLVSHDIVVYIKGNDVYKGEIPWNEYIEGEGRKFSYQYPTYPIIPMGIIRKHCQPMKESEFLTGGSF